MEREIERGVDVTVRQGGEEGKNLVPIEFYFITNVFRAQRDRKAQVFAELGWRL